MYKSIRATYTHNQTHHFKTIWLFVCMLYYHFKRALWAFSFLFFIAVFLEVSRVAPIRANHCHLTSITTKPQSYSSHFRACITHKKRWKAVKVLFLCPRIPFSHHTPGQIMSLLFERKSESNLFPGNVCAKCHDFTWLYFVIVHWPAPLTQCLIKASAE